MPHPAIFMLQARNMPPHLFPNLLATLKLLFQARVVRLLLLTGVAVVSLPRSHTLVLHQDQRETRMLMHAMLIRPVSFFPATDPSVRVVLCVPLVMCPFPTLRSQQ